MSTTSSPAGPSRHRGKPAAENWDDDFEFAIPPRSSRKPTSSSSSGEPKSPLQTRHLHSASGESKANRQNEGTRAQNKPSIVNGKAKEVEEEDDWDVGGSWDEDSSTVRRPAASSGSCIPTKRVSSRPMPLIIPSNLSLSDQTSLGPPRSSTSSASPLPSPTNQSSSRFRPAPTTNDHETPASRPSVIGRKSSNGQDMISRRHPSTSFTPQPTSPTVALSNGSSSSLASWKEYDRSSPNPAPLAPSDPHPASNSNQGHGRKRELRHMKSGDIMPPPPIPPLAKRRSQKTAEVTRSAEVRESHVPFSPSMEQLKGMEEKKGFWKRLSGNPSGVGKGSPNTRPSPQNSPHEHRRRRSSSTGSRSPSKSRTHLPSPSQHPIPPLPSNIRSSSAASNVSAASSASASSQSRTNGVTGILRRSTSNLTHNSTSGTSTPPTSYSPALSSANVSIPIPVRTSSRSSRIAPASSSSFSNEATTNGARPGRRTSSISKGYHLPSPAPGSPYSGRSSGYFDPRGEVPPLPRSSSLQSASSVNGEKRTGGLNTDNESDTGERDETQITPKRQRKVRPVSAHPAAQSSGWRGEGWTGFPSAPIPHSSSFPVLSIDPSQLPIPPSRTTSQSSSRIPSSHSLTSQADRTSPPTLNVSAEPEPESSKSFSTLRRLSSLSKKHGRRISGGWKFGTGSSTSTNSSNEERRNRGKLETVVGSPIKQSRVGTDASEPMLGDEASRLNDSTRGEHGHGPARMAISASETLLRPQQASRDLDAEWDKIGSNPLPAPTKRAAERGMDSGLLGRSEKDKRRQRWNDFVIPRNVLEKQKEWKKGIEGVKRFAGGVESLKSLLATHSELVSRLSASSNSRDLLTFSELDQEFSQWWEMATVLIEVGSTGRDEPMSPGSTEAESPKRTRRVTLASDEAKSAADMMRRSQSTPYHPGYPPQTGSSPLPPSTEKKDLRKISLPDPQDLNASLLGGGPPRASPDLWRASTGRQDLSKRQLEVLRTMLRTPVSDPSVPSSRNDGLRGMKTISASSTSASIVDRESAGGARGIRHASRPSIARGSTSDSRSSQTSFVRFDSPEPNRPLQAVRQVTASTPTIKTAEMFPSPNDSAYIVPSHSFPSPNTASTLAYGISPRGGQITDVSKMRRGSKVGLAGLKEFIKGLKGKESKKDLRAAASGLPNPTSSRNILALLSPTSPTFAPKYPFAWRHRPTPSMADLHQASLSPSITTSPPSHPPQSGRGSRQSSIAESIASPTRLNPAKPTAAGPPVSGKERKRPGLRGIFRAGSGSWSDLVRDGSGRSGSRESISIPIQYPRVGSGGSTESAPNPPTKPIRHSSSVDQLGFGMRSTSGPSRLTLPVAPRPNTMVEMDDPEMQTLRPQRKSRIMGLGWPEEAAAAREMGRLGSDASFKSDRSEIRRDGSDEGLGKEVEDEITIALTPESLPVLLEYLRQCEAKLGEWRERVKILEGKAM